AYAVLYRATQVHQFAMEEVTGVGNSYQLRWLLQAIDPGIHLGRVDDLIGLALDHQPRAVEGCDCSEVVAATTGGRRDHDQHVRLQSGGGLVGNVGTKTEAGNPELCIG